MRNFPGPERVVFGIILKTSLARIALHLAKQLGALPVSGVNRFAGEGQGKMYHVFVAKEKINAIEREKIVTSEKVATSEGVEKGTKNMYDMKEAVFKIRRKDLDNF